MTLPDTADLTMYTEGQEFLRILPDGQVLLSEAVANQPEEAARLFWHAVIQMNPFQDWRTQYQWAINQERQEVRLARQSNDELQWKIKQLQAEIRYLKDPLNETMKLTRAKRIQREDRVFAYRETGMTFIAIGKILKMSPARVSQCYWTAVYRRKANAEADPVQSEGEA